jgi:hypothetical protein
MSGLDTSMEEVFRAKATPEQIAEHAKRAKETVMFRGVERRIDDVNDEGSDNGDESGLVLSGSFTVEETERGAALIKPFNDKFSDDSDHSMTMYATWLTEEGFFYLRVVDDLTDSTRDVIHEKDLPAYLAQWGV